MATYTKTVDPNGGSDYASLNAWEAGEQTLYSSGDIAIADCRRTGAIKDTTAVTVAGWTTGVIPKIIVNAAHRHEGKWADQQASGNYIYKLSVTTAIASLTANNNLVEVDGLVLDILGSNSYTSGGIAQSNGYSGLSVHGCLFFHNRGDSPDGGATSALSNSSTITSYNNYFYNNIVIGYKRAAGDLWAIRSNYGNTYIYNNSVYDSNIGIARTNGNVYAINNLSLGCITDFLGAFATGSDYNVSSDATAPGTNKATGKTAYTDYFVDPANGDFHLKDTSLALFGLSGTDLSGTFSDDIDGVTRTAPWDIGADQYVDVGGATISSADPDGLTVTGLASADYRGLISGAPAGELAAIGVAATSVKGFISVAESGAIATTGTDATGTRNLISATVIDPVTVSGANSTDYIGHKSIAAAGSISTTGVDSTGVYTPVGSTTSTAQPGATAVLGVNASGIRTLISLTEPGAVNFTGFNAFGVRGLLSVTETGAIAVTGANATDTYTHGEWVSNATPGYVSVSGYDSVSTMIALGRLIPITRGREISITSGRTIPIIH